VKPIEPKAGDQLQAVTSVFGRDKEDTIGKSEPEK